MAIQITAVGKISPTQPTQPMKYYPRAVKTGVVDLEKLSMQIAESTTLTEADCQAVVISLVATVSRALAEGNIVRLGHLGSFQISLKGTGSETPNMVTAKNVRSASIVYRPGYRFKKLLKKLDFKIKKR
ncbi:HU family DNA-binding protein [Flavobacterium sp. XGLA_31]|uniref:HU family DNA-binding protein n=1 Tax=Flavobacterium sp. XGLA_31 TaxID=3447666 RepID=UPI003F331E3C